MSTENDLSESERSIVTTYRRNGKLWSCESCRKGKLACDHKRPVCSRCLKRGKPELCIYHPAPLTKPRAATAGSGVQKSAAYPTRRTSVDAQHHFASKTRNHNGVLSPSSSTEAPISQQNVRNYASGALDPGDSPDRSTRSINDPSPAPGAMSGRLSSAASFSQSDKRAPVRGGRTGFLGPTSYSAVYTENSSILELPEDVAAPPLADVPPEKIFQGVGALEILKDLPVYRKLLGRWDSYDGAVVPRPIFQELMNCLWQHFGPLLEAGKQEDLWTLSRLVWENTQKPLKVNGRMAASDWARAASGHNLRWEVVSLIIATVGALAMSLSDWDSVLEMIPQRYTDRHDFADQMRRASEMCLCAAYECDTHTEIYCMALFTDLFLLSALRGDAHYAVWQRNGEVLDNMVAMGIHRGNRADASTPFFLAETRKRLFMHAYSHDMGMASYLGRPPRASYRFCRLELPLDLSDDELCSLTGEEEASRLVDTNGWNIHGRLQRNTWLRVHFRLSRVLEDILELALSPIEQTAEELTYQAEQVRRKIAHLVESTPALMQHPPEEMLEKKNILLHSCDGMFLLWIHCALHYTEFLLQRALINRLRTDAKQLIPVARRILSLVLLAHSKREIYRDSTTDFTYMVSMYGLPSAGYLSIALLQEEQSRNPSGLLPRSEVIQDLSVFISALASIGHGEGNFAVCDQGRRALKRVLDQILSPAPSMLPITAPGQPQVLLDSALHLPTGNDADFLNWLETVEWDKTSFLGEPIQ